jgi:hypothetical protein
LSLAGTSDQFRPGPLAIQHECVYGVVHAADFEGFLLILNQVAGDRSHGVPHPRLAEPALLQRHHQKLKSMPARRDSLAGLVGILRSDEVLRRERSIGVLLLLGERDVLFEVHVGLRPDAGKAVARLQVRVSGTGESE